MPNTDPSHSQFTDTMVVPQSPVVDKRSEKPQVRVSGGSRTNLSGEVNNLLRDRLRITSLILSSVYFAFTLKGLLLPSRDVLHPELQLGLQAGLAILVGVVAQRLCVNCTFALNHLRGIEFLIFGSSGLFFAALTYNLLTFSAGQGFLPPVAIPWLVLMFTYAIMIPNTWKRALFMLLPIMLAPLAVLALAVVTCDSVAELIQSRPEFRYLPLETLMVMTAGTVISVAGVGTIRSLRSEAFEAKKLGRYRLKRLLGRGGMGEVYLAEHLMLKRPCAIKLIRPEMAGDPSTLARFEREVQSMAKLTHWNTVEVFDFGRTEDGTFYYVMEYLPGLSLDHLVENDGPMPAARVIHLLTQACDALAEAHSQGMIHRDIKPGNLFAARRGGIDDVTKLLDFGLVRSLEMPTDLKLTQEGTVTGSPLYMSPEQASGEQADARSDIYALGCVAYYLLTGRPPFEAPNPIKLILAHAQQTPQPPSSIRPEIPRDLEAVVLRSLEKDPADRFQTVQRLKEAMLDCQDAVSWSAQAAEDWWHAHGCPKKRELDECICEGRELILEDSQELPERQFLTAGK